VEDEGDYIDLEPGTKPDQEGLTKHMMSNWQALPFQDFTVCTRVLVGGINQVWVGEDLSMGVWANREGREKVNERQAFCIRGMCTKAFGLAVGKRQEVEKLR
jgi:hypothetical protein